METCVETRESPTAEDSGVVFFVTDWTGGCVDGKRDGRGVLNLNAILSLALTQVRRMEGSRQGRRRLNESAINF